MNMKSFRRILPGQTEEIIEVSDEPNEPIDISYDPDDTHYICETFEEYKEFCDRAKLY